MLAGTKRERPMDLPTIKSHFASPRTAAELARINATGPTDLLSRFYMGPEELAAYTAGAPFNTDDNALIEFNAPRRVGAADETIERNVKEMLAHAASPLKYVSGNPSYAAANADLLLEAALRAVKRDDRGRAEQLVSSALEVNETAQGHSVLGELRFARGDESGAIDEWITALALDPDHFYTLINLGRTYLTRQEIARAVPFLDRAIQIDPSSARAHHLRGLAHQANGEHARAVHEYRRALPDRQYTRSIQTYYLNFGTALMSLALYDEAAQMLEEYVKLAPKDSEGHLQLGVSYEIIAERTLDEATTRRAIEELKLALGIQPRLALAHYYLSKAYRRLEMYDEADAEFELYERMSP
jgi:Tfp pilus assembly protein PilF